MSSQTGRETYIFQSELKKKPRWTDLALSSFEGSFLGFHRKLTTPVQYRSKFSEKKIAKLSKLSWIIDCNLVDQFHLLLCAKGTGLALFPNPHCVHAAKLLQDQLCWKARESRVRFFHICSSSEPMFTSMGGHMPPFLAFAIPEDHCHLHKGGVQEHQVISGVLKRVEWPQQEIKGKICTEKKNRRKLKTLCPYFG